MNDKNNRPDRSKPRKCMLGADGYDAPEMYNMDMIYDAETLKLNLGTRLAELRIQRNVSAREMSISLGHGAGYINSIENGHALPSVVMLFEICDYLDITPKEFFEYTDRTEIASEARLTETYRKLGNEEREILMRIMELLESERRMRRNEG